ncbi:protease-4 [Parvibacter caecicola]|uniref:Protease-4 n=2 Tax=Parvibacter caecicola TaxID=747645 RepID=A0A7W5D0Z4_9ACTN|nr:signal peptide peptidase SppA [Parvibacter caecicola]MBB3170918.1 protease-4 [Parvibacter caecicola]MCR2042343.1 signal peptide peptidase SppA [Parvibacter caecicola]
MSDSEKQWQNDMWPAAGDDAAAGEGAPAGGEAAGKEAGWAPAPAASTAPYGGLYTEAPAAAPGAAPASAAPPARPASSQPAAAPASAYAATYGYGGGAVPPYGAAPAPAAAPTPVAPPKKGGKGWIVGLAVVICLFLLCAIAIGSCTSVFSASMGSLGGLGSVADEVTYGDTVGVINIDGTIQYDGSTASPEGLKAQLDRAEADDNIVAVVLRVNSGGGTATAGEEMAIYVRDFSKPIVVSSASMNASAAYEISSQADYIFTAETTAIGSIGTAMQITDYSGLLEKLGIRIDNITSAESKDSTYGDRALSEEERAYYQQMVDQINATFIEKVAAGRGMTEEEVRALATGLTFTGIDAVENGLADEIGTLEDAMDFAAMLGGVSSYDVIYLQQSGADLSSLLGLMGEDEAQPAQAEEALQAQAALGMAA